MGAGAAASPGHIAITAAEHTHRGTPPAAHAHMQIHAGAPSSYPSKVITPESKPTRKEGQRKGSRVSTLWSSERPRSRRRCSRTPRSSAVAPYARTCLLSSQYILDPSICSMHPGQIWGGGGRCNVQRAGERARVRERERERWRRQNSVDLRGQSTSSFLKLARLRVGAESRVSRIDGVRARTSSRPGPAPAA